LKKKPKEAVSKRSILFKVKEGDPAIAGLTTPVRSAGLMGQAYVEYFEDKAKASLRAKC